MPWTFISAHVPKDFISGRSCDSGSYLGGSSLSRLIPKKIFTKHYVWGLVVESFFSVFSMVRPISAVLLLICRPMGTVPSPRLLIFKRLEMSILAHMLRNGLQYFHYDTDRFGEQVRKQEDICFLSFEAQIRTFEGISPGLLSYFFSMAIRRRARGICWESRKIIQLLLLCMLTRTGLLLMIHPMPRSLSRLICFFMVVGLLLLCFLFFRELQEIKVLCVSQAIGDTCFSCIFDDFGHCRV